MSERKNDGILSADVKKLLILQLVWKANQRLQFYFVWILFFIMRFILEQNHILLD